ncbi:MAG: hypothetical protein SFV81_26015 [Pirellulaceae bacterium]|nr:hypothetical protein [Pirellulaceae bacterium]
MADSIDAEIRQVLDDHAELCEPPFTRERSDQRKRLLNRLRVLFARQHLDMIRTIERIERLSEQIEDGTPSWREDCE